MHDLLACVHVACVFDLTMLAKSQKVKATVGVWVVCF